MVEFPNKAAEALRDAAEMTVVERARQLFDTMQPFAPHNWKGDLSESIRTRTTRKSKTGKDMAYAAIIIEYGPVKSGSISSKAYWKRFEAGGKHGDWPRERMEKWVHEKLGIPEDMVDLITSKIIKKLEKDGANSYPILEQAWEDSQAEFITEWRNNLRHTFSSSSGGGGSTPF